MMLDINFVEMREGFLQYLPVGLLVGIILMVEILLVVGVWVISPDVAANAMAPAPDPSVRSNTAALGDLIYTDYVYLFQSAGMILLVAMIGAIVLTLRTRDGVKKQVIADQISRSREASVELKKIRPGEGV